MATSDDMGLITQAAQERKLVRFDYVHAKDGMVTMGREGEPYEFRGDKVWIWDTQKGEIRQFFLENVSNVQVLDITFVARFDMKIV